MVDVEREGVNVSWLLLPSVAYDNNGWAAVLRLVMSASHIELIRQLIFNSPRSLFSLAHASQTTMSWQRDTP